MRASLGGSEFEPELFQNTYRGAVFNLNSSNDSGELQLVPSKFDKCSARFARQPHAPVFASEIKRQRSLAIDNSYPAFEVWIEPAATYVLSVRL